MNVSSVRPRLQLCQQANPYGKGAYRQPSKGTITDLVIDLIGLKVLDEGEWKVRKHGANLESNDLY